MSTEFNAFDNLEQASEAVIQYLTMKGGDEAAFQTIAELFFAPMKDPANQIDSTQMWVGITHTLIRVSEKVGAASAFTLLSFVLNERDNQLKKLKVAPQVH